MHRHDEEGCLFLRRVGSVEVSKLNQKKIVTGAPCTPTSWCWNKNEHSLPTPPLIFVTEKWKITSGRRKVYPIEWRWVYSRTEVESERWARELNQIKFNSDHVCVVICSLSTMPSPTRRLSFTSFD